jgi:arsenate reductase
VLNDLGIDTTSCRSKPISEFSGQPFDLVITVCDNAREACPVFPGAKEQLHWPFDDPAHAQGTTEQQLVVFRRVRDEIAATIRNYLSGR